jgi:hypothetical protein
MNYEERGRILDSPTLEEKRIKIKNSPNYIKFVVPLRYFDSMYRGRHNMRLHQVADNTGNKRSIGITFKKTEW